MNKKYTFPEFIAAQEEGLKPNKYGLSFDNPNPMALELWKKRVPFMLTSRFPLTHEGDCTNESISCPLCSLERLLREYRQYYFHEERFRKNYDE